MSLNSLNQSLPSNQTTSLTLSNMCRMYKGTITVDGTNDAIAPIPIDWTGGYIIVMGSTVASQYMNTAETFLREATYDSLVDPTFTSGNMAYMNSNANNVGVSSKTDDYRLVMKSATPNSITFNSVPGVTQYIKFVVWAPFNATITNISSYYNISGIGAPTFIPAFIGQHYIDTLNNNIYISSNTSAITDWLKIVGTRSSFLFSDDFNRVNGAPGNNWTVTTENADASPTYLAISSNTLYAAETNGTYLFRLCRNTEDYSLAKMGYEIYLTFTYTATSPTANTRFFNIVFASDGSSTGGTNGTGFKINYDNDVNQLSTIINGTVANSVSKSWTAGTQYKLHAIVLPTRAKCRTWAATGVEPTTTWDLDASIVANGSGNYFNLYGQLVPGGSATDSLTIDDISIYSAQ